ncbi:bacterioferritin [Kitasatospora sp. NE20-6]|uniref:ferritin-like domain-containing protein n=1 Tax=Kitasatospora sp. NE20-6 TaxID=2859066 RepID=UPI0034DC03DC
MAEFLTDVHALRDRARSEMMDGPVTAAYGADLPRVIEMLNTALATEIVCTLRYRQHHYMAKGLNSEPVAQEFLEHSNEEQGHADLLAARIAQLGGTPDMDPARVVGRSHAEYVPAADLKQMIQENLVAERIAVATYTEMITWLGDGDPTTKRILETVLAAEEEHADDMLSFLEN